MSTSMSLYARGMGVSNSPVNALNEHRGGCESDKFENGFRLAELCALCLDYITCLYAKHS